MSSSIDSSTLSTRHHQEEKKDQTLKPSQNNIDQTQNETMFQLFDEDDDDIDSAILNVPLEQLPSSSTKRTGNSSKLSRLRVNVGLPLTATSSQTEAGLLSPAERGSLSKSNRPSVDGGKSSMAFSQTKMNAGDKSASTLPYIDDTDDLSSRTRRSTRSSNQTISSATTVSQNEHVQAMKVANLMKAAEESLKPTTPYIAMQNVNNLVWNRMRGKSKRIKGATSGRRGGAGASGPSKRLKTTTSLLEQVNSAKEAAAKSSVQSSDSDSDY